MSQNLTEVFRRKLVEFINDKPLDREALEVGFGKDEVWDTQELQRDFTVLGFLAPFCKVQRKSDGKVGLVMFQHHPRFYFGFEEDTNG